MIWFHHYRYAYHRSSWLVAGKADPAPPHRLHSHPDGPFTAEQLKKQVIGFEKVKIPSDIYARILNNRKKLINDKRKFQIERCDFGMQNCQRIVESRCKSQNKLDFVKLCKTQIEGL